MRRRWMMILLLCLVLAALPVRAEVTCVVDMQVWSDYTVAIAEVDSGERLVCILMPDDQGGYTVRRSGAWPGDAVFYGVWSEGRVEVMWDGNRIAWYQRQSDGEWYLSGLQDHGADTWYVGAWCGLYEYSTGQFIVGNTAVPLAGGPTGDALFDMVQSPDRAGWAVVNTPGSAAPLYTAPDETSTVQGSFFTGAPVQVLEEGTEWCRVAIGTEDALAGWMPMDSLAVGADIATVTAEFPRFGLSEETWEYMPPEGPYIAIGEKDGQLILLVELDRLMTVTPYAEGPEVLRLPVEGKVIQYSQLTIHDADVLLVIAEDGDARRLWVCETDAQGVESIRKTKPLPWDVELDAADKPDELHELTLRWDEGRCCAWFDRRPDGEWLLSGVSDGSAAVRIQHKVAFCGVLTGAGKPVPCSFNGLAENLFNMDAEMLFDRAETIDYHGWAMVETFLAEVYADREAAETGREYAYRLWQGTPLRILKEEGGLCQVELGTNGLTGWVYAARLAMGDEIEQAALLPDLCVMDNADMISTGPIDLRVALEDVWPVGETADGSQAIILLRDGSVGYCPSACIHHGNG